MFSISIELPLIAITKSVEKAYIFKLLLEIEETNKRVYEEDPINSNRSPNKFYLFPSFIRDSLFIPIETVVQTIQELVNDSFIHAEIVNMSNPQYQIKIRHNNIIKELKKIKKVENELIKEGQEI